MARREVAKYLAVVGGYDKTLEGDDIESLTAFVSRYELGDPRAPRMISGSLLDKFALAGTPDDALAALEKMNGVADRFEFGTPHGLADRPAAIHYIAETVLSQMPGGSA